MGKDTELIWVDKDFAEKWKALNCEKETRDVQEKIFNEYLESAQKKIRDNFKCNLEELEEDAAIFTGLMLKVKQAFEKAKNEHLNASYELWERFDAEIPSVSKKVQSMVDALKPLQQQLSEINNLMGKISTFQIDKVISSISMLASAYGKEKDMIDFLIKNFNTEALKP